MDDMNVSSDGSAGLSRREFVKRSALTGAGMGLWTSAQSLLGYRRANAEDAPSGSVSTLARIFSAVLMMHAPSCQK